MTEPSWVLPVAIALLSEHVHECIETLMNKRPSMVERPGRSPAQYSARRDRGAIGAAAAAQLLQPLICIQLPRSSHRISVTDRTTIMEVIVRAGCKGKVAPCQGTLVRSRWEGGTFDAHVDTWTLDLRRERRSPSPTSSPHVGR